MAIWIALYVGYAAIVLCAVEFLLIERRIKRIEKKLDTKK